MLLRPHTEATLAAAQLRRSRRPDFRSGFGSLTEAQSLTDAASAQIKWTKRVKCNQCRFAAQRALQQTPEGLERHTQNQFIMSLRTQFQLDWEKKEKERQQQRKKKKKKPDLKDY